MNMKMVSSFIIRREYGGKGSLHYLDVIEVKLGVYHYEKKKEKEISFSLKERRRCIII